MAMHDYKRFNSVSVREGLVRGFSGVNQRHSGEILAFTGIHVLERKIIEQIPDSGFFHIIDLYERLAAAGRISCHRVDGSFWRDIGTPEDYLDLHARLLTERRGRRSGCRTGNSGAWCISNSAVIANDVKFSEWGAVGAGARIGSKTKLSRCVIWDDVNVGSGQQLTDMIVCKNSAEDGVTGRMEL